MFGIKKTTAVPWRSATAAGFGIDSCWGLFGFFIILMLSIKVKGGGGGGWYGYLRNGSFVMTLDIQDTRDVTGCECVMGNERF